MDKRTAGVLAALRVFAVLAAILSTVGAAKADLIVKPVGLSVSKIISEPGSSNDVFQIFNASPIAVDITGESVVCANVSGDPTDKLTKCVVLRSAKGRTIPGADPDGTQHSIFASVDFSNTDAADVGPPKDGKNTLTYSVTGSDGSTGSGVATVFVSDVPEPNSLGLLVAAVCPLMLRYGRRRIKQLGSRGEAEI